VPPVAAGRPVARPGRDSRGRRGPRRPQPPLAEPRKVHRRAGRRPAPRDWSATRSYPMLTDAGNVAWTGLLPRRARRPALARRRRASSSPSAWPRRYRRAVWARRLARPRRPEQRVGVVTTSNAVGTSLLHSYPRPGPPAPRAARRLGKPRDGCAHGGRLLGGTSPSADGRREPRPWVGGTVDWTRSPTRPRSAPPDGGGCGRRPELLARDGGVMVAIGATCSHQGGPLGEGTFEEGCVTCPWHGSVFRLADGRVERGPASVPQPRYAVRVLDGRVEVRRERPPAANAPGF